MSSKRKNTPSRVAPLALLTSATDDHALENGDHENDHKDDRLHGGGGSEDSVGSESEELTLHVSEDGSEEEGEGEGREGRGSPPAAKKRRLLHAVVDGGGGGGGAGAKRSMEHVLRRLNTKQPEDAEGEGAVGIDCIAAGIMSAGGSLEEKQRRVADMIRQLKSLSQSLQKESNVSVFSPSSLSSSISFPSSSRPGPPLARSPSLSPRPPLSHHPRAWKHLSICQFLFFRIFS